MVATKREAVARALAVATYGAEYAEANWWRCLPFADAAIAACEAWERKRLPALVLPPEVEAKADYIWCNNVWLRSLDYDEDEAAP